MVCLNTSRLYVVFVAPYKIWLRALSEDFASVCVVSSYVLKAGMHAFVLRVDTVSSVVMGFVCVRLFEFLSYS